MTTAAKLNPYLKTKVLTASPAELRLMLLDGAIRFAEQAKTGLEAKNYEQAYNGTKRCQDILMELIASLRPNVDPELTGRMSPLYTFMFTHMMHACSDRDAGKVAQVIELLQYERETWLMVMQQLAGGESGESGGADDLQTGMPAPTGSMPTAEELAQASRQAASRASAPGGAPGGNLIGGSLSIRG